MFAAICGLYWQLSMEVTHALQSSKIIGDYYGPSDQHYSFDVRCISRVNAGGTVVNSRLLRSKALPLLLFCQPPEKY